MKTSAFRAAAREILPTAGQGPELRRILFDSSPIPIWEEDFSDIKKFFEGLRRSGVADFRKYFESHPQAVASCVSLVRIIDVNRAAQKLYGAKDKKELLGNLARVFTPESYPVFREELIALAEGKRKFECEGENKTLKGSPIRIRLILWVVPQYEKELNRVFIFATDITERARVLEKLEKANERTDLISRATNDAVWDWDLETDALWWSEGFYKLFGYGRKETKPDIKSWTNRLHPDDLDRVKKGIFRVIKSRKNAWSDEYRFCRKDGSYAFVYDRGTVIRDAKGKGVRMIGSMMDTTGLKRLEEALRREEIRTSIVLSMVPAIIWSVDKKLRFTSSAGKGLELLNQRPQEVVGKTLYEYFGTQDRKFPAIAAHLRALAGESVVYEQTWMGKVFFSRVEPIRGASGEIEGVAGFAQDVTGLKRIEENERIRSELEGTLASLRESEEGLRNQNREIIQKTLTLYELRKALEDANLELMKEKTAVELKVDERTRDLRERTEDLERMNKVMVGRELRMIELKEEIARLRKRPGGGGVSGGVRRWP